MAFQHEVETVGTNTILVLHGELDAASAGPLRDAVTEAASGEGTEKLVLDMTDLTYMASAGLRVLVFAKQKLGAGVELVIAGAQPSVVETIELTGFHQSVTMVDSFGRGGA